ncbi:MAG: ABC transporter substrate-binding protein [Candidatus Poribacteria bacterium]|nr:MAG: ABC transporter substrate-binding protein [Candidatus Poribacteria bacterium]
MRSWRPLFSWALIGVLLAGAAWGQQKVTLRMTGPDWLPVSLMTEISKDFPAYARQKLGYEVEIVVDPVPWGSYYERLAAALAAGTPFYDLFVSDSQWIGDFAESGHLLQVNEYLEKDPELRAILDSIHPVLRRAYCTYPGNSENYWGFPQEADIQGFLVRQDLFQHPQERENFKARYGYELPQTYEDWKQVEWTQARDFAEFFTRKAGEQLAGETLQHDFYGLALAYSKSYDFLSMAWMQFLYNWGGDIWNWETHQVDGYINSPEAIASFQFYKDLLQFQPPGAVNFDLDGVNNAMAQGLVAMACNWIAISPSVIEDPSFSRVVGKVMVVFPPGQFGRRIYNLGGQPFVINAKTQHVEAALEYIKWWFQPEQQWRFARGGGLPSTTQILDSEEFKNLKPWTRAFAELVPYQRDVWKHPAFFELLTVMQEELHAAITGGKSVEEALNNVARRQEEILADWE